ncbi:MAG: DUF885 family protein [Bacteriovoracaceae bacterium]
MKFISLFLFFILASCSGPQKQTLPNEQLDAMFESYWEEYLKFFPFEATRQGDNRYNHLLPNDQSKEYREDVKKFYQTYLAKLKKFDRESLNTNDQISYDIFDYELKNRLAGYDNNFWMIPFQQFWGLPLELGQFGSGESIQPFKNYQDYKNWLSRLEGFTPWTESAITNFREGMKAGIVLPTSLVKKMIPQMEDLVVKDPTKSIFYGPIKVFPKEINKKQRHELKELYKKAILTHVIPNYKKLADFFKNEYIHKSRATSGINALPGGDTYYKYLVETWTTTDKSPDEIYEIGLKEVARIRSEMERVKEQVGFKGPLSDFFVGLRNDPKLMPFTRPKQVIHAFESIHDKIKPRLINMFGRVPKTPFMIKQTEAFRAASASAEYNPGSPDGTRPGIFYIPIIDAKKFNITSGMESLFLHEAIPGHHYQISLQQENQSLPKFRRFAWYGAYGEGWALYTESLGRELGLYTDPYQYMGALGDEMHRAVRLVVDVGLHQKGLTREAAIQYLLDNEPIPEEGAIAEVERYMAIPGQALSYKIGSLKIWELRKKYEKRSGYKLSDFHDEFLKDGCMPLKVVEEKMDSWSNSRKI